METGNTAMFIWSTDFGNGAMKHMGKRESLQQMVLEKLDIHMQNNKIEIILHHTQKLLKTFKLLKMH